MSDNHVLYVTSRQSSEYLILTARVMGWEDDSPRNIRTDVTYDPDPFAGIVATAQGDRDPDRDYSYGWRFGLASDETMPIPAIVASLRTLQRASKRVDAAAADYGQPATFGAFVARIATALGVKVATGRTGPDGFYTSGQYNLWTPGDAVNIIDGWLAQHRSGATVR